MGVGKRRKEILRCMHCLDIVLSGSEAPGFLPGMINNYSMVNVRKSGSQVGRYLEGEALSIHAVQTAELPSNILLKEESTGGQNEAASG